MSDTHFQLKYRHHPTTRINLDRPITKFPWKNTFFSTFFISVSVAISNILLTLAAWTVEDCLLVLISSFIAVLNIMVAGSFVFDGRLLLKLSADFAFQNFFSKSSIELLIFLNTLFHRRFRQLYGKIFDLICF